MHSCLNLADRLVFHVWLCCGHGLKLEISCYLLSSRNDFQFVGIPVTLCSFVSKLRYVYVVQRHSFVEPVNGFRIACTTNLQYIIHAYATNCQFLKNRNDTEMHYSKKGGLHMIKTDRRHVIISGNQYFSNDISTFQGIFKIMWLVGTWGCRGVTRGTRGSRLQSPPVSL